MGSEGNGVDGDVDADAVGESRWPMAIATICMMVLGSIPPTRFTIGPIPSFSLVLAVLLAILVLGDPGRIDRRSPWLRIVLLVLVSLTVLGAVASTILLIVDLVHGSPEVSEAGALVVYVTKVWIGNTLAFGLLYWSIDRGGPAERVHHTKRYPDFVFPQMSDPTLAGPDWRPRFIDYLYIAFTSANAFSPTDTLPLTGRAKFTMQTQALISFAILTLGLARVVSDLI